MYFTRPRNPAPPASYHDPAAVVEGRGAPRFIRNPGPAIERPVDPVAVVVRSPTGFDMREPDWAVVGLRLPVAGAVQVVIAMHFGTAIAGGDGVEAMGFEGSAPMGEFVKRADFEGLCVDRVGTAQL